MLEKFAGLVVKTDVYNLDGTLKYENEITTGVQEDGVKKCFVIPPIAGLSKVYFLRLSLKDSKHNTRSINWYWLSQKPDELEWKKSKWYYTPQSGFADFKTLKDLQATTLNVNYSIAPKENETKYTVTVTNIGKAVAFFVHLLLPFIFSDNYIYLAPGESRIIECSYENKDAGNGTPYILTDAWNLNVAGSRADKNAGFEK